MIAKIIGGLVLSSMALVGCKKTEVPKKTPQYTEPFLITGEFDTSAVIKAMGIVEADSRLDLIYEEIDSLNEQIDTIELTYYFAFCDCQDWVKTQIHEQAAEEYDDLDELDARGQVQFNLYDHGYYIESAADDLEVDWRTMINGTTVRFIGREYSDRRLPDHGFTVPDPPLGKVFRYYSYEILRPYKVWGPDELYGVNGSGDSLIGPTTLTVK